MTATDDFIYYTFPCIKTELNKDGIEKKKPINMPNWKNITRDNYKDYVQDAHHCRAVLTGIMSGITVIDFDDMNSYERMLQEYPDLKMHRTIRTKKGVHIYCKYDATVLTTVNASEEYAGVDIRNDSAIVFAPPTKYKLLDGTIYAYIDEGGDILPIPDIVRSNLKQCKSKVENQKIIIKKNKTIKAIATDNEKNQDTEKNPEIVANNQLADFDKFVKMKNCFSPERLNNYDDYIKFTIAVKLCFGESGRQIWKAICKKCLKYDKKENKEQWNNLKLTTKECSFGSLCFWAREDNPELYMMIFGKKTNWVLSEAEFAKQFKKYCFKENVIFTGNAHEPEGYMFNDIYWVELSLHNAELQKDNFDKLYDWYVTTLNIERNELPNDLYLTLKSQIKTLNSYRTRCAIIKIFKSDNYQKIVQWNLNKDLFIFEDKVYNLQKGEFTEPNTKDYMNLSCGKKYDAEILDEGTVVTGIKRKEIIDKAKEGIKKFLKGIVNDCDYDFFLKQMASFLKQENKEEKGYFWLGQGRNGKGTTTDVLRSVLGSYWGELNMEYYINQSKDVDRPNQNLFNCRNARVLNSSEVNDTDAFNRPTNFISANFKAMTGQDVHCPREVGTKRTAEFVAGKTLIQTNKMPSFSKIDLPLKERIVVQEFPFTFTDDADLLKKDPSKYKIKDITLKEKFKREEYRIAFTDILFEKYKEYKIEYIIPPSVKKFTQSYFAEHCIKSFIEKYFEESNNENISLEYIKQEYLKMEDKKISVKILKEQLEESGYDVKKNTGIFVLKFHKIKVNI
jgi:phage/plasmid-associated DNA primase